MNVRLWPKADIGQCVNGPSSRPRGFQLLLGPALDLPSLRRHRQIALDAHEIIYCISFFTAVVRLRAEADAQLLDGCVSDDSGAGIAGRPN